jgi:hypothetical protein
MDIYSILGKRDGIYIGELQMIGPAEFVGLGVCRVIDAAAKAYSLSATLDRLEALYATAPAGHWHVDKFHPSYIWAPYERPLKNGGQGEFTPLQIRGWGYYTGDGDGCLALSPEEATERQWATGRFVAEVHNAFPDLLAAARELATWNRVASDDTAVNGGPSELVQNLRKLRNYLVTAGEGEAAQLVAKAIAALSAEPA